MEEFYRTTTAFIVETMVESRRGGKRLVMEVVRRRIEGRLAQAGNEPLEVLMAGDGSAGDTLFLHAAFGPRLSLHYFDVPGSKTYDFAMRRLAANNVRPRLIEAYDAIPKHFFDVVISLEVLEHLPDPPAAVRDIGGFLKTGGICLVTESFYGVLPLFPTHLTSNLRYGGLTRLLFLRGGMVRTFFNLEGGLWHRPTEYRKPERVGASDWLAVARDHTVMAALLRNARKRG
jgi:SAM-dependent methyltransferase